MDEPVEGVVAPDSFGGGRDDVGVVCRSAELLRSVRPSGVVVAGVLGEDVPQVLLVVGE